MSVTARQAQPARKISHVSECYPHRDACTTHSTRVRLPSHSKRLSTRQRRSASFFCWFTFIPLRASPAVCVLACAPPILDHFVSIPSSASAHRFTTLRRARRRQGHGRVSSSRTSPQRIRAIGTCCRMEMLYLPLQSLSLTVT